MTEEAVETVEAPEWVSSIEDEGLRETLGKFETSEAFLKAANIEAPKAEDWRGEVPEDLKKVADRFTSVDDMLRSIQAFQKREGQIRIPGKNATDEERATYRKAVGIPDDLSEYEFPQAEELTDEVKASQDTWRQRFKDLEIPKDKAKALIDFVHGDAEKILAAQEEADGKAKQAFAEDQISALKKEWGEKDFELNSTLANRALNNIADRAGLDLDILTRIETKEGVFLLDRPEILKMFAIIGREMAEGTLGPVVSDNEKETMQEQIELLRKQQEEAQIEGNSKKANRLYQKELDLIAKMQGDQPVVGSAGRTV